jgi:S1-C subfamily serine protease
VETAVGGGHAVNRPWLGAKTQTVTTDTAKSLGLDRAGGAMVTAVYPGGPAARAGLGEGDVIVGADGQPVTDEGVLNYRVATHKPGETIPLQIRKGGGVRTVEVRLEAPSATPARDERTLSGREPLAGATVVNLSPAVADEYGLDPSLSGVMIVKPGQNYAAQAGFQAGDIIRAVNGEPVHSTSGLVAALQSGRGWRVTIEREGRQITASFGL